MESQLSVPLNDNSTQYISILINQLSCPKRKKTELMYFPDPSKSLQSEGFAYKHTLHF